jgi:hypothetical protein
MLSAIQTRTTVLRPARAVLWLLVLLPFVIGWIAGLIMRVILLIVAAVVEGYTVGRG